MKRYFDEIFHGSSEVYLCEINLAEFYYKTAEKLGIDAVNIRYEAVRASSIKQVAVKGELIREAAKIKVKYKDRISPADSFLIALTYQVMGIALTTDRVVKEKCEFFEV